MFGSNKKTEILVSLFREALPGIQIIYLFGTAGTEFERSDSDIDIAILCSSKLSDLSRWELAQKIALALHRDVDIIDLQAASTVFRFQIVNTGRKIYYQDKKTCDFFEIMVYSSYLHFNEERQQLLKDIQERGSIR